jgi:hypothetical protein
MSKTQMVELCTDIDKKLKTGKRGQETELIEGSPLRR